MSLKPNQFSGHGAVSDEGGGSVSVVAVYPSRCDSQMYIFSASQGSVVHISLVITRAHSPCPGLSKEFSRKGKKNKFPNNLQVQYNIFVDPKI